MARKPVRIFPRLIALTCALALAAGPATAARGADSPSGSEQQLRGRIESGKSQERSLASAASRLGRLERAVAAEVAVIQGRLDDTRAQLASAQTRLAATERRLDMAKARALRLRTRLATARDALEGLLRARYMDTRPDLVNVVLDAHGFADLLERFSFLHRVEDANAVIVHAVREARLDARRDRRVLVDLEQRRSAATAEVRGERDALAAMRSAADSRRSAVAQARAARLLALRSSRADRLSAQRTLDRLLARRAREAAAAEAVTSAGPGGPWAIPWAVVQCESGGQNLPPNGAGASGYYQMLPDTWRGLGGSTPEAHLASKAEQDRLAAKLWNGGSGASNWVCAALVGAG